MNNTPALLTLSQAQTPAQITQARELFLEYGQSLGFSLCFQSFDQELAGLPGDYAPPDGRLFLASSNVPSASWTASQHDGAGNYALSDGSVQQATSSLLANQVHQQGIATNRLLLPLLP